MRCASKYPLRRPSETLRNCSARPRTNKTTRAAEILREFVRLHIPTQGLTGLEERAWALALEHERSAYNAAYLALAEHEGMLLITGDRRLYNAVKGRLPWVRWVGDYQSVAEVR